MAKERPLWIHGDIDKAFWRFVAQKLKVALNITAALPLGYDAGQELKAGHGGCHKDNCLYCPKITGSQTSQATIDRLRKKYP